MNLVIAKKSEKPIYEQLYEQIVAQIINKEVEPHFCLPSIRNVATELGVSVITIKKAWEMLEKDNFIYTISGKGCFVAEHLDEHLCATKINLARDKVREDLIYYQQLGISKDDLVELIIEEYNTKEEN